MHIGVTFYVYRLTSCVTSISALIFFSQGFATRLSKDNQHPHFARIRNGQNRVIASFSLFSRFLLKSMLGVAYRQRAFIFLGKVKHTYFLTHFEMKRQLESGFIYQLTKQRIRSFFTLFFIFKLGHL